jgi:RsiW-degrading membrane proteinase PrsW (M82 family)
MPSLILLLFAFAPVFIYLGLLLFLDSYKLVRPGRILAIIGQGILAAVLAWGANSILMKYCSLSFDDYSRFIAPIVEESLKAGFIIRLMKTGKIGFLADGAIYGFAVGAGFALFENIYYYSQLNTANPMIWIIRGLGTAIMHGSCTACFAITAKALAEKGSVRFVAGSGLALCGAVLLHGTFNAFLLPPIVATALQIVLLPVIVVLVYIKSESGLKGWLEIGLDTDMEILNAIHSGQFLDTRIGKHLDSLRHQFEPEVLADMLCYLQIHLELAVRAKGLLLLREVGMELVPDDVTKTKFVELGYLHKSIGITGRRVMETFLHFSTRDLWHVYFLSDSNK